MERFHIMAGPRAPLRWIWYPFGSPLAAVVPTADAPGSTAEATPPEDQGPSGTAELPTANESPPAFIRAFGTYPRPRSPPRGCVVEIEEEDES